MTLIELVAWVSMLPVVPSNVEPVQVIPESGALMFSVAAGAGLEIEKGRQVTVQFKVTDDQGRELASTAKRGMPYTMVMGATDNDPVLASMMAGAHYGEHRIATFLPDQAYGAAGIPAIVPKGRSLTFYMRVMMPEPKHPVRQPSGR